MEAVQFDKKKGQILFIEAPQPTKLATNEVLVEVAYAGICGTDLHIAEGAFPCRDAPVILGHEFSGVVAAVGSEVTHLIPGDRIAVDPNCGCHNCESCHGGNYHYCKVGGINNTVGIWSDGGWAQYCKVAAEQVHKVPENITLEQEPLSCISHGWDRIAPIPVGSTILILGAGIIGNLWASILHLQGHRRVIVSEPQETRRKLTQNLGTGFDIITPDELKDRKVKHPSWGVDLVIDCSGHAPAIEDALALINPGGKMCIFGVTSPEARISISPFLMYKNELTIIAVNINPFSFPKAVGWIEAMGSRYLAYGHLGIKTYTLRQHKEALEALKEGTIAKAMFKIK